MAPITVVVYGLHAYICIKSCIVYLFALVQQLL